MKRNELSTYLDILYEESRKASEKGEIPVSAVLVFPDDTYLVDSNQVEDRNDPFSHAEFNVIQRGMKKLNSRYLPDCILIINLEPCLFCLGAIVKSGIKDIYYVLDDDKLGSLSHYHVFVDDRLHVHRIEDDRFKPVLDDFFKKLR